MSLFNLFTVLVEQVSKILGFKVVKTEYEAEKSTGAEQCEYRTGKYWADRFKPIDAPYKMQVTTQPLTPDTAKILDQLEADIDSDTVDKLGDRAFYTDGNDLVAVVGDVVLQVEVTNIEWNGNELQTYILGPEFKAMQLLVDLFKSLNK